MLWTREELLSATSGREVRAHGGETLDSGVDGISIDTRSLVGHDLFIALSGDPGDRFQASSRSSRDGHDFLEAAAAAGATAALVHRQVTAAPIPLVEVADTLDGLWDLGRFRRSQLSADSAVVAVTGSSGKTTAKSFLRAALGAWAESGSLNNHLGVPLSLARTPRSATTAVYEIGTNHPGEIAPLSQLARPNVAIVLNVQSAHIGNFGGFAALRTEKLSIASGIEPEGTLVLDHSLLAFAPRDSRVLTFGTDRTADVHVVEVVGDRAIYAIQGREVVARVPGGGAHRALTLAAVLTTVVALGREIGPALELPDDLIPAGRGVVKVVGGVTLLDDSYNANPASMRAALIGLHGQPGRQYALLGEMLELGDASAELHRQLADVLLQLAGFWCVGEGMRELMTLPNCLGWYPEADGNVVATVCKTVGHGDALLIKGSNRVFWARGTANEICNELSK